MQKKCSLSFALKSCGLLSFQKYFFIPFAKPKKIKGYNGTHFFAGYIIDSAQQKKASMVRSGQNTHIIRYN